MAITINGVTYRNLPEQVKENAENIESMKADIVELQEGAKLKYEVVDELPETGESGIIYLVPMEDGEQPNIYEEYLWVDGEWEMIGTTAIDLSNYVTLDGTQYITGDKSFKNKILITNGTTYGDDKVGLTIKNEGWVSYIKQYGGAEVGLDSSSLFITNNNKTLGNSTHFWGNTFTKQVNFGTNIGGRVTSCYIDTDAYDGMRFYCNNTKVMALYDDGIYCDFKIIPNVTDTTDIGSSTKKWKDYYTSGNIYLSKDGVSREWRLNDDSYGTLNIASSNSGGAWTNYYSFQTSCFLPLTNAQDLGASPASQMWRDLYMSGKVKFSGGGNLALSGGNGYYFDFTYNGTTCFRVQDGSINSNNKDLGTSTYLWKDLYLSGSLKDGTNSVPIANIAQKGVSLVTSGAMTNGRVTFNVSDFGSLDDGLYIVVFNNTQVHLYLTSTMFQDIAQTGFPITQSCVVPYTSGGNLVIKAGVLAIDMPTASTIRFTIGTASLEYPEDNNLYVYKTKLL